MVITSRGRNRPSHIAGAKIVKPRMESMQTRNILNRLPVVIIAVMIICAAGIIVAFNYHKIFKTDAIKVTNINLHDRAAVYIDNGVYNKAGIFLKDQSFVDSRVIDDVYVSLDPADDDDDA